MSENTHEPDKNSSKSSTDSKSGDEQLQTMSVDKIDPAILVVRDSVVRYRYSKTQLIELRDTPISRNKPTFINYDELTPSILVPEKWNLERKKSDTPTENGSKSTDSTEHRRRPNDPRERIRKENDGIVLSPQRRSFNSGCFVPVSRDTKPNRSHSPLGPKPDTTLGKSLSRDGQSSSARRIGSGRIMRDWDIDRTTDGDDYSFRSSSSSKDDKYDRRDDKYDRRDDKYDRRDDKYDRRDDKYDRRDDKYDKYERRSFGHDFDTKDKENKKNGRYSERRKYSEKTEDEPEWFSSGPISQNDTIELRGFDESEKPVQKKKLSPSRVKRAKEWSKKKNESQTSIAEEKESENEEEKQTKDGGVANVEQGKSTENKSGAEKSGEVDQAATESKEKDHSFNFDDILKCDTIPGLLTNGVSAEGDSSKSRFSRWFKKESPDRQPDSSRRSSSQEENQVIKDLMRDFTEPTVSIPGDYDSYFAPISPAANTGGNVKPPGRPINIVEMMQKHQQSGGSGDGPSQKQPSMTGKILSLHELESMIRHNNPESSQPKQPQQKPNEEMAAAFKKLLAQAGSHSNGPTPKTQPMSLLELLNHTQQQEEAARMMNQHNMMNQNQNMSGMQHGHNINMMNELTKLQQQKQMEMLNKLINNQGVHQLQVRASPLHDMGAQQSRDLLNRPEAQAILQGLKRGEITNQHLYQQLANPALQPRHRDMLSTILKVQGGTGGTAGYGPSPRALSPVPPQHFYQQQLQQQQLRVSPLPPNAMHQRIPSPRELQVHTQNILQRALIKKKLEEQTENYRKKQEMQRGSSPGSSASKSVSSPTPLAFTPTSVLRKMTAEKDEGKENRDISKRPGRAVTGMKPQAQQPQMQAQVQQQQAVSQQPQWAQQFGIKQPAGRPIVKANNYPQSQTAEQFFREQQQQRLFSAQQQAQQRKNVAMQQQYGMQQQGNPYQSNPYGGQQQQQPQQFSQQLTQQQMRAQHQARPANQQSTTQQQQGQQQSSGGGSTWQQLLQSAQNTRGGAGRQNEDTLSPTTTNQLARWFSPDLLERARGGELPSTAGLPQHVLSLEEIERQTAPPVHN